MTGIKFQIGKLGITPGVIDSLLLVFKNNKAVRISVLKSSGRDRESIGKMADEIAAKLSEKSNFSYSYKIIGFTIIMRKHSRS
jgi:RNA-binding protein YhbY